MSQDVWDLMQWGCSLQVGCNLRMLGQMQDPGESGWLQEPLVLSKSSPIVTGERSRGHQFILF